MSETLKLVAILVADVVGYSRLAGADEERTLARLRGLRSDLIDPAIAANHELIFLYALVGATNPPSKPMRVFVPASALVIDFETSRALWQVSVKLAANNPLLK
jgi:class 3 adenylate cyclase